MQTTGEAKSQGRQRIHTNIYKYTKSYLMRGNEAQIYTNIQNHISWGVNEAHRIPGLTGSGIRTTKAKETVNNLKDSRCLEYWSWTRTGKRRGDPGWLTLGHFLSQRELLHVFHTEFCKTIPKLPNGNKVTKQDRRRNTQKSLQD